jgi:hypothetical protein
MPRERLPQAPESVLVGGEQDRAGGGQIEAVNDATAKPAFADPHHGGLPGDKGIQQSAALLLPLGMDRAAGGLVDSDPPRSPLEHAQRTLRLR